MAVTESAGSPTIPVDFLIVIQPERGWVGFDLGEVWRYRELLYFLAWRDIKLRYRQTLLGAAWAVIQPLLAMVVFTLFFGKLAQMPSDGVPYAIFSYCALVPWTYFANALSSAGNSLVGSANLISKVYFPRLIVPGASVLAGTLDFGIAFSVLLGMMLYYGIAPSWGILLVPVLFLLTMGTALGVGTWLSALNVEYRDVRYVIPFMIQLWMFATPIVYPLSLVPERYRLLVALNPMAGIIEGYRAALLGRPFQWSALAMSAALCVLLLLAGVFYFRTVERTFADVI
jgi:lipopolysaccharide transport system permease protein